MNVAMPIAAVLLDLGFPSDAVKAVPILARTAGLLAHLAEEREQPLGFLLAAAAEEAVEYEPPAVMLEPEVETRPWDEQLALDDAALPRAARLPLRALAVLPGEARRGALGSRAAGSPTSPACR